jgi:hypothetical protein
MAMGSWYRVTKRINGRLYDYWQRTYRVGKSVKTENRYIGPTGRTTTSSLAGFHSAVDAQLDGRTPYSYFAQMELAKRVANFKSADDFIAAITDDYYTRAKAQGQDYKSQPRGIITIWAADALGLGNKAGLRDFYEKEISRASSVSHQSNRANSCQKTISQPEVSITAPYIPEEATAFITPTTDPLATKLRTQERAEDERIQYGNIKDRIARQKAAVRKAKRETKGINALNPFLAQAIKKP